MERTQPQLIELELAEEYRVAKDEVDPRGWVVVGCDGDIGKVRTLLVDTQLMRALYFVCDLESERAVLLPITYARLDKPAARVIFDVIDRSACEKLPVYLGAPPTPEESAAITDAMTACASSTPAAATDRRQLDRRSA